MGNFVTYRDIGIGSELDAPLSSKWWVGKRGGFGFDASAGVEE